jgi:glycosyltransferase involved in cell wall biosynthesis
VLFSQVFEVARLEAKRGSIVVWFAVIPLRVLLMRSARRGLSEVRAACLDAGVEFRAMYFGSGLFSLRMLRWRKPYVALCAWYVAARLRPLLRTHDVVVNARSYFAAAIAIGARRRLTPKHKVRVCFDMRGYLSLTFPSFHPRASLECYGRLKLWEAELLQGCDVALNNRFRGLSISRLEYGIDIEYLPVSGLSESERRDPLEASPAAPKVAFVGNFSEKFHSFDVLRSIQESMARGGFATEVICEHTARIPGDFETRSLSFSEMPAAYRRLSALVIPGRAPPDGFFDRMAIQAYSAPTKMSEALSVGVPIIVGSGLTDIAEFALRNRCGIVFDLQTNEFHDSNGVVDITDARLWKELREQTWKVASSFTREHVYELYRRAWFSE